MDITQWLRGLGLPQYETAFIENEVDWQILPKLNADDLKEIGVTAVGHRRRLLEAIAKLALSEASEPIDPPSPVGAERRQLTIMFCDLVGSTALASRLDPEDLRDVIGAYHAVVAKEVEQFGGFVAKYMGDGVLSYFGYPRAHEDDAERAVRVGLSLVDAVQHLDIKAVKLQARVGIATGLVVVGDLIGEGAAQERGVVGETPNLAARLQELSPPAGVMISDLTRRLVGELFEVSDLGAVEVKGFDAAVPLWRVLRSSAVESRFEALRSTRSGPLIGRAEEIDFLLRRWRKASAGQGQVVLISGEPGIGKSRLAAALQEPLRDERHVRLRYFCSPHHRDSVLHPFIAQLERAAGFDRDDPAETKVAKLEALLASSGDLVPETIALFSDLLGLPASDDHPQLPQDPQRKRELTISSVLEQLEALSQQQPLLVIFEDAHWADSTSLELLDRAVERLKRFPVLLLVTFRPEFAAPWVGQAHVASLSLNRLTESDTTALVGGIAGGKPLPTEILDRIIERTDGIPLFVEELTKSVLEGGLLREQADAYVLAGPLPPLAIPASLQDSLMARLDRLAPVKEVAQIGAALGREFSYEVLAAVARRGDTELRSALDQLTQSELVFRRGTPPRESFIFKHALVQDAAYSTLLRSQRQELHGRIAKVLEQEFSDTVANQPEILAHHYTEAGIAEIAIDYWRKAGERAVARSANAEAIRHLEKGIELAASLPAGPERNHQEFALHLALGPAVRAIKGQTTDATLLAFSRAHQLMDPTIPFMERLFVLYGLWGVHLLRAEHIEGKRLAEECLALAETGTELEASVLANRMMGLTQLEMGKFPEAAAYFQQSLDLSEDEDHYSADLRFSHDHRAVTLMFLAMTLWCLGYQDKSDKAAAAALDRARALEHAITLGTVLMNRTVLSASFSANLSRAGVEAEECLAYSTEHRFALYEISGRINVGISLARGGFPRQGIDLMRSAMAAAAKIKFTLYWPLCLGHLAAAHAKLDEGQHGLALLGEALEIIEQTEERHFEAELHRLRGEVLLKIGRAGEGEAELVRAMTIAAMQQAKFWELRAGVNLARLWADRGERAEARELLRPLCGWFTEGFDAPDLQEANALLQRLG